MRQPYLHDLICAVRAPAQAISGPDGQIRAEGVQGVYVADRRMLSRMVLTLDGVEPAPLRASAAGDTARFVSTARGLGDGGSDPTVLVRRVRRVVADGVEERIEITTYARTPVRTRLAVQLGCDLAAMAAIRTGEPTAVVPGGPPWSADGVEVHVHADPGSDRLEWPVNLERGETFRLTITVVARDSGAPVVIASTRPAFAAPEVQADDRRLAALVAQSVADLDALLLADPGAPDDGFLGAGVPWYLTLFGRDSIWAARMLLPLGTDLAAGTLRTLARRQGTRTDVTTGEQPGKILHEIRRPDLDAPLPPVYYGTVDATPLWISLLHDAWRWGLPPAQVAPLLPNLEAALAWLGDTEDFVSYRDTSGRGLANQGWKDSPDAVQFSDGALAAPPIALCEVQGYAYAAARQGGDLLDAFGRPGAQRWREWADALAARFRARFWTDDGYPAIALAGGDGRGRPVDTVTSNIGHLLGTGLLDDAEEAAVAARLAAPDMDGGYGLRTLASTSVGYNPQSYHCGSVWPHDTAIVLDALPAAAARSVITGLLAAAAAFDYRLPELYAGTPAADGPPVPYPPACRPQAWSAGAAIVVLRRLLGLRPDVPNGVLRLAPLRPSPVGELTVHGLRVAGERLDVHLTADGMADVIRAPSGLRVEID
ncbi:MAG TPA: glycogen debranching N-terminal domain-containing protein [Jatrophihabitantaceae bacterium]|jgi:glycogen debranching enzyme